MKSQDLINSAFNMGSHGTKSLKILDVLYMPSGTGISLENDLWFKYVKLVKEDKTKMFNI